jgi:DNA-binding transcriptional MerR regulator
MSPDLFDPPATGPERASRRQAKSAEAFRTISEVAQELEVPQHVLRFWESRFPQVKPLKRAGGRRYYRPDDVVLLRRIRQCLYDQGYTIKGVQKLLREGALKGDGALPRPPAAVTPAAAAVPAVAPARGKEAKDPAPRATLVELRRELQELRDLLMKCRR